MNNIEVKVTAFVTFTTISKVMIIRAAFVIFYELQNMHTKGRSRWYVDGKKWKIDRMEVKIIVTLLESLLLLSIVNARLNFLYVSDQGNFQIYSDFLSAR